MVLISSAFPSDASTHPFHARRAAFQQAGYELAYVRASDVVAAALALRPTLDVDTAAAWRVAWHEALSEGLVLTRAALLRAVRAAADRER